MRYYDIVISKTQNGPPVTLKTALGTSVAQWTSHPNGKFNPAAFDVEFDLPVGPFATPLGNNAIRIYGVDLATLRTAIQFAGQPLSNPPVTPMWITVRGGMMAGLPLNNPKQAGVLAQGLVWQSYANWRGTEMTIDLQLNPGGASLTRPVNLVLNWRRGTNLQPAIQQMLAIAFPGVSVRFAISQNLVAPTDQIEMSSTLVGMSQFVSSITQQMQGQGSLGVQIVAQAGGFIVFDGTVPPAAPEIAFTDLIGQPTWQGPYELWLQTVMRADIHVGDLISLPPQLAALGPYVLSAPQSYPAYRSQSVIQGKFIVQQVRHLGRFRTPDGAQWSSTFICNPATSAS